MDIKQTLQVCVGLMPSFSYVLCGLGGNPSPGRHASDVSLNVCIQLETQRHKESDLNKDDLLINAIDG